jgi:hypothetical protein
MLSMDQDIPFLWHSQCWYDHMTISELLISTFFTIMRLLRQWVFRILVKFIDHIKTIPDPAASKRLLIHNWKKIGNHLPKRVSYQHCRFCLIRKQCIIENNISIDLLQMKMKIIN